MTKVEIIPKNNIIIVTLEDMQKVATYSTEKVLG
jgi:hypothetical protein